ncbi:hypothetical protein ATANTOWER_027688 [Ataeniobius toweri]|uniref:Uncharacterized protein n=1 Tax=Ataeniobius toweri TaxID=208326 RepID=A0ABU7BBU9_9TELE|nr:hypothetical protein [Ataeniobius toweri]
MHCEESSQANGGVKSSEIGGCGHFFRPQDMHDGQIHDYAPVKLNNSHAPSLFIPPNTIINFSLQKSFIEVFKCMSSICKHAHLVHMYFYFYDFFSHLMCNYC